MLSFGTNISSVDTLRPLSENELFRYITEPDLSVKDYAERLKTICTVDAKRYQELKKKLQYFVCATFTPPIRKTENFASIEYFVVDIDHISANGLNLQQVREKVISDSRVRICFVSPSKDGLKILFKLKSTCYDAGLFSAFYKVFVEQFALQYRLEQAVDTRTSDVTRACFIPYDPTAYSNPLSDSVDINTFINPETIQPQRPQKVSPLCEDASAVISQIPVNSNKEPDADCILRIKQLLGQVRNTTKTTIVYVPEQLNQSINGLKSFLEENGVIIDELIDIQYGKKIRAHIGNRMAECNLFFGKRGFSAVASTKRGTDPERNEMLQQLINLYFQQHY